MPRSLTTILLALLTAACGEGALAAAREGTGPALGRKTLTPRARLALPWLRGVPGGEPGAEGEDNGHLTFVEGNEEAGEPARSAVSLDVLVGSIGGEKVMFVDHDADGTYFTPFTDFIVREKGGDLHPVSETVVLGRRVFRVEYDEAARRIKAAPDEDFITPEAFPSWAGAAAGLAHLNDIRGGMNLLPVALNREASRGAMLHIKYLVKNGGNGHVEEWYKPGYTREGMEAGIKSIGSMNLGGIEGSIDGHLASLLHRMDLIDPRIREIGIAMGSGRVWIHTEVGTRRTWEGQGPVIFPGPEKSWHVGYYSGENPDPRPKGAGRTSGLPVTAAWYGKTRILKVKATLSGRKGKIKGWKNDADGRELTVQHSEIRAVIMPTTSLTSGRHVLTLTWEQDGKPRRLEHVFRIGRR